MPYLKVVMSSNHLLLFNIYFVSPLLHVSVGVFMVMWLNKTAGGLLNYNKLTHRFSIRRAISIELILNILYEVLCVL